MRSSSRSRRRASSARPEDHPCHPGASPAARLTRRQGNDILRPTGPRDVAALLPRLRSVVVVSFARRRSGAWLCGVTTRVAAASAASPSSGVWWKMPDRERHPEGAGDLPSLSIWESPPSRRIDTSFAVLTTERRRCTSCNLHQMRDSRPRYLIGVTRSL